MSNRPPRISVVIPVYNQSMFLRDAIESVLSQTWKDMEIIVVDDGSTDSTPEVIASYADRIRPIRKENGGGASALNEGIKRAQGEWIAWLSADDLWESGKLMKQVQETQENPSIALVYTDYFWIGPDGAILRREHTPFGSSRRSRLLHLIWNCYINGSTVLVRRDVFSRIGLFDESNRFTADFDMWFRILDAYDISRIGLPLARYRVHQGQVSTDIGSMEAASGRVVANWVRRMGVLTGAVGVALYAVAQLCRLPFQVGKSGTGRGAPLPSILRNIMGFWVILVSRNQRT